MSAELTNENSLITDYHDPGEMGDMLQQTLQQTFNHDSRIYGIDILRIFSMLMIIIIHSFMQGGFSAGLLLTDANFRIGFVFEVLGHAAVTCYAVISGYVGIKSRFRYSKVSNLWLQAAFYTISITLIMTTLHPEFRGFSIWLKAFMPVTTGQYWYLTSYFGVLLLMPVINAGVRALTRKENIAVFASILLFMVLFTNIVPIAMKSFTTASPDYGLSSGYSFTWLLVCYILGAVMREHLDISIVPLPILFVALFASWFLTWYKCMNLDLSLLQYCSPTVVIMSMSLFGIFLRIKIRSLFFKSVIRWVSESTFGIYLIHVHPLIWSFVFAQYGARFAKVPTAEFLFVFIGCSILIFLTCLLLDKIRIALFKLCHVAAVGEFLDACFSKKLLGSHADKFDNIK